MKKVITFLFLALFVTFACSAVDISANYIPNPSPRFDIQANGMFGILLGTLTITITGEYAEGEKILDNLRLYSPQGDQILFTGLYNGWNPNETITQGGRLYVSVNKDSNFQVYNVGGSGQTFAEDIIGTTTITDIYYCVGEWLDSTKFVEGSSYRLIFPDQDGFKIYLTAESGANSSGETENNDGKHVQIDLPGQNEDTNRIPFLPPAPLDENGNEKGYVYGEPEKNPTVNMSLTDEKATLRVDALVTVGTISFEATDFLADTPATVTAKIEIESDFKLSYIDNNVINDNITIGYLLKYDGTSVTSTNYIFTHQFTSNTTQALVKLIEAQVSDANLASKPAGSYTDTVTVKMSIE